MTQDLASVINDGLYYYEQELWESWDDDPEIVEQSVSWCSKFQGLICLSWFQIYFHPLFSRFQNLHLF